MPSKKFPTVWTAEPHTIAKIEILKGYLVAWFQILGRSRRNQQLLYVDGFAGPGEYTNYPEGSPLAALSAARIAIERTGNNWIAGNIHCAFIEEDSLRFQNLARKVDSIKKNPRIVIHPYPASFVEGLALLKSDVSAPFKGENILDSSSPSSDNSEGDDGESSDEADEFRELARLLFLDDPHRFGDRIIAVVSFGAYFDLSTGPKSPVVCMSGYLSSVDRWVEFSRKWRRAINKASIPCFHMTDWVARAKAPFDNPNEKERIRLMRRLVSLINQHTETSFHFSMLKADYDELFENHRAIIRNPWQFLALMAITGVRYWAMKNGQTKPIPIFFDRGDKYSGEFKAGFDYWLASERAGTLAIEKKFLLGSLTFGDRCQIIPLQAADVLAYEGWKFHSQLLMNPSADIRRSLQYLWTGTPPLAVFANRERLTRIVETTEWPQELLNSKPRMEQL